MELGISKFLKIISHEVLLIVFIHYKMIELNFITLSNF